MQHRQFRTFFIACSTTLYLASACAQTVVEKSSPWSTVAIELLILLPVAVLAIFLKRRAAKRAPHVHFEPIEVSQSALLGNGATAHTLKVDGRKFLVVQSKNGSVAIAPFDHHDSGAA